MVFLHATVFDYRFGFTALGSCAMGSAVGVAITRWLAEYPTMRNTGIWFALAGFLAAINACTSFIVPFGSAGTYLYFISLVALSLAFWVMGLTLLKQEQNIPEQWFFGVMVLGAEIGIIISFYVVTQSSGGPLFMAWLAAAGMIVLALAMQFRIVTLAISSLSLILLGVTGSYNGWNFKAPPHWVSKDGYLVKPYYADAASNKSLVSLATQWDALSRTDVAYDKKFDASLGLVFKNGALTGLLPFDRSKNENSDQFKKDFPLVALPLMAGQAQNILVINSSVGLAIKAANFDVSRIRDMESNLALKTIAEQHQEIYGPLFNNPGIQLTYGNVRNALRQDHAVYDQIYLTIPQNKVPGWTEPGMSENYLYTKEAFRDYWAHLRPGGMLVVLTGEEMAYMRALLTAWDVLNDDRAWGNNLLIRQAWGYHMAKFPSGIELYHYLLMLSKGPVSDDTAKRMDELTKNMILEELFGPNQRPPGGTFNISQHPYYILYHPQGLEIAQKALGEYMAWTLKAPVDTDTPTDRHPNFFQVVVDMELLLKWLLGICAAILIYIYLFPLGVERRLLNSANSARPPLPVHLTYFMALGAGSMMALAALTAETSLLAEHSSNSLAFVLVAMVLGAATAFSYRRHGSDGGNRWRWIALATVVLFCILYSVFIIAWETASVSSIFVHPIGIILAAYPTGLFTALLLLRGLEHLTRNLRPLFPWAIVAFGVAGQIGVVTAFWLCQYWGWNVVWTSITGCYLAVLAIGTYLHWPTTSSKKTNHVTTPR
ncbi:MAG TPA: hypothetical protein VEI95_02400 [Acidobacteriota bacterium]|nr:hypothetical protein [Acidobacteriota bacterium]